MLDELGREVIEYVIGLNRGFAARSKSLGVLTSGVPK